MLRSHRKWQNQDLNPGLFDFKKALGRRSDIPVSLYPERGKVSVELDSKDDHMQNSLKNRRERQSPLGGCCPMANSEAPPLKY